VLDIMRNFASKIGAMSTETANMAASIGGVQAAMPDQPQTLGLRNGLNSSQAAVQAAVPALASAQNAVNSFTGNADDSLDNVKELIQATFSRYAAYYTAALLVGVIAVLASLAPVKVCKPIFKTSLCCNLMFLLFVWIVAGVSIIPASLMSDFCISPGPAQTLVALAQEASPGSPADTLEYYLLCKDKRSASDPNFNPPGAYGSIVAFSRQSNAAIMQVMNVSAEIRAAPASNSTDVEAALDTMDSDATAVRTSTHDLVELGSCTSIGGRVFAPLLAAVCNDITSKGFVQFWATHMSMACILALLQLVGMRFWFHHPADVAVWPFCSGRPSKTSVIQLNPTMRTEMPPM